MFSNQTGGKMSCKKCNKKTAGRLCNECRETVRWCSKCQNFYSFDKFPPSLVGHLCRECKRKTELERRKKKAGKCIDCNKNLSKPESKRCVSCSAKKNINEYNSSAPKGHITKHGYRMVYECRPGDDTNSKMLEHRWRMEIHLDRKLKRSETVHHKNGNRLDNSIGNLELWCSNHCSGTRVKDKIEHSIDFLLEYFDLIDEEQLTLMRMKFNGKE